MIFKRIRRLAFKLLGNVRSLLFYIAYFALEVPVCAYHRYIKKRSLKQLGIRFPIFHPVCFNRVEFLIYFASKGIIEEMIFREGVYEEDLLNIADRLIRDKTIVIDVGANIGFISLYLAKKYPDNLVLSYEPVSLAYGCLEKSRNVNALENMKVFKTGVGASADKVEIHSPTPGTYNKGLAAIDANFDLDDTFVKETIDMVCLDAHVPPSPRVSFIKIDVQGYEFNVLKGAKQRIEKDKPAIVFEQFDGYHTSPLDVRRDIASFFAALNYELYCIRSGRVPRPYCFLEKIDIASEKAVNGDIVAIPVDSAGG